MDINQYKNIKPLVIGIGVAGKRHLNAQVNLGIKTGVYTTNSQTAKSLREQKSVVVFDDLDKGLDWSNLVHVCTPDDKHTEFVAKAVEKGKTVLCEKSFTTNLEDALYLQDLAHKFNTTLIIGQNYRLTPSFEETKRRVQDGQLGNITHIETTYLHDRTDFQRRYNAKNFLYIGGSHAIDLASWVADQKIVRVKATFESELKYEIAIEFSSGLMGNIKLDASLPQSKNGTDLIVEGEKGKLVSHNKVDELLFNNKGFEDKIIKLHNIQTLTIPLEVKIVDDYLSGKLDSYKPLPGVDEAVNIIKVLTGVQKSISSGESEKV